VRYGCFTLGYRLLEIGSFKDSPLTAIFFEKSRCLQKKRLPAKKALACKKSVGLQFFFVPAIFS
jgi:hypothetical protein